LDQYFRFDNQKFKSLIPNNFGGSILGACIFC
jgi:hypothetical protein